MRLELHRDDAKGGPDITLTLDEARELLRGLQSACDQAYRVAKLEAKRARGDAELEAAVDRVQRKLG